MSDVVKAIEALVALYERTVVAEIEQSNLDEAEDAVKRLGFWREQHVQALQYRDHLEQRRRFAEMERQAQPMGRSAFGVGSFQRGRPQ